MQHLRQHLYGAGAIDALALTAALIQRQSRRLIVSIF